MPPKSALLYPKPLQLPGIHIIIITYNFDFVNIYNAKKQRLLRVSVQYYLYYSAESSASVSAGASSAPPFASASASASASAFCSS